MNAPAPQGPVLQDIHLPIEPGWWPPAPGWWLLAGVIFAVLVWVGYRWRRWQRRRARAAQWLTEFDRTTQTGLPIARVRAATALLRRAAHEYAPANASLPGERWLDYLKSLRADANLDAEVQTLWRDGQWRPDVAEAPAIRFVAEANALLRSMIQQGGGQ